MAREAQKKVEPALKLYAREPQGPSGGPEIGSYESVADLLRRTREQYGEDLRSVAEALRIRYVHLLAIEEGRFRDLPGSTYALGFVRSYAEFLGLDGPEMVERFKEEVAELNRKTQLVFPTPVPEGKVPGGALILISVILLGVAYGAWTYLSRPGATIADLIPPVPEHLQSLSGEGATPLETAREDAAAGPANGSAVPPAAVPGREPLPRDGQTAAVPPAADAVEGPAGPPTASTTDGLAERAPDSAGERNPAPESAVESPAADGDAPADGLSGSGRTADQAPAGTPEQSGQEQTPPAEGTLAESRGESAAGSGAEFAAGAADEPANLQVPAPSAEPGAFPESGQATAGAEDAEALRQARAPADHLENGVGSGIPAAPQLTSRVPGREPQVYGADNQDARIVLRAHQDSWVQVRDAEDSLLLTRVLRQGDEYRVPNRAGLTLLTGNAGGIEILVDGRRLPPLGPLGAVRRDIALDPDQLGRVGAATE